jgi:hypothetical protein
VRKTCPEIARGTATVLDVGDERVLAMRYALGGETLLTLHNLSADACTVCVDGDAAAAGPAAELLSDRQYEPAADDGADHADHADHADRADRADRADHADLSRLAIGPHGYRWLRLGPRA